MTNSNPFHLLAVDRNIRNLELLTQFLGEQTYQVSGINSITAFEQLLTTSSEIDLALIDISGFDHHIWQSCKHLQDARIPFLILSSQLSARLQQQSRAVGAHSLLIKPLVVKQLLETIHYLLEFSHESNCHLSRKQ